jgi:hypothetical protein
MMLSDRLLAMSRRSITRIQHHSVCQAPFSAVNDTAFLTAFQSCVLVRVDTSSPSTPYVALLRGDENRFKRYIVYLHCELEGCNYPY